MEEINSIDIVTESGDIATANVVTFLRNEENKKDYVLYSFETDEEETKKIYASIFIQNENGYELLPIEDEEEWKSISEEISRLESKGE